MIRRLTFGMSAVLAVMLVVGGCGDSDGPQADAGADISIKVGESPTFDGCGSGGSIDNYRWVILEAPDIMEGDAGKVIREIEPSCSFTLEAAMEAQEVGTWLVELTVSGPDGATSVDTVTVDVQP